MFKWLREAGVAMPEHATHIVIDIEVGDVVRIYATAVANGDMLKVNPPPELRDAEVIIIK